MGKALNDDEIRDLLAPLGNVDKAYYIDAGGEKHYVDKLPPCGGFVNKGAARIYIDNPNIIAYKDK